MIVPNELLEEDEVFIHMSDICDGRYAISNKGRCYSFCSNKMMKAVDNGAGYMSYRLAAYVYKGEYIHRLVAKYFIPNPENKPVVNHIDHNKSNNCVENLEWCTAKENTAAGIKAGKINSKERCNLNKLTDKQRIECVIYKLLGYGVNQIAKELGFARTTISSVFNNRSNPDLVDLAFSEFKGYSEQRLKLALERNTLTQK